MDSIAIVKFVNRTKGQSRAGMSAVMKYAMRNDKTMWEGQRLVGGIGCSPQTVYNDFLSTKLLHRKEDNRMYYHMVLSFPKGENVPPDKAHEMALRLAEHFKGFEVLVCTHTDRDHIHSHFIINSVSMDSGKKFHISTADLEPIRKLNDQLCMEYGFSVYQPQQKKSQYMSTAEYHAAEKGESWKWRLMGVVDDAMRYAHNREEFMELLALEGYSVSWSPTRKSITYTCPNGKRCRDYKMHDDKYLKEKMEHEFRIRGEIISGGIDDPQYQTEPTADSVLYADPAGTGGTDADTGYAFGAEQQDAVQSGIPSYEIGTGEAGQASLRDAADTLTGWEEERAQLFSAAYQTAPDLLQSGMALADSSIGSIADGVVQLGRTLERTQNTPPMRDATMLPTHHGRGKKRKLGIGQREDDHEIDQGMQMM